MIRLEKKQDWVLSCAVEVDLIIRKFNETNEAGKVEILKKLKEIANPGSTFLLERKVKIKS